MFSVFVVVVFMFPVVVVTVVVVVVMFPVVVVTVVAIVVVVVVDDCCHNKHVIDALDLEIESERCFYEVIVDFWILHLIVRQSLDHRSATLMFTEELEVDLIRLSQQVRIRDLGEEGGEGGGSSFWAVVAKWNRMST